MAIKFDQVSCKTLIEKSGKDFVAFPFFMEVLAERNEKNNLFFLIRLTTTDKEEIIKMVDAKCFVSLVRFEEVFCQKIISQLKTKDDFNEFKDRLFLEFKKQANATFDVLDKIFGRYSKNDCDLVIYHDRVFDKKTKQFILTNHHKVDYLYYNKENNFYLLIQNQLSGMGEMLSGRIGYGHDFNQPIETKQGLEALHNLSKDKLLVYSFLGWIIGAFYLDEIKKAKQELLFPIFMIYGSSGQGKTELTTTLLAIYSAPVSLMGFSNSTAFTMEYMLKHHLRTAVYYDEFRSSDLSLDKKRAELLRTVPFAGVVPKGRADLSVVPFKAESSLILTGESPFEEQAETRRAIMFDYSDSALELAEWKAAAKEWKKHAFSLFRYIVEGDFNVKDYLEFIESNKQYLKKKNSDICFGALAGIFGIDQTEVFFADCQSSMSEDIGLHNADLFFRNVEEYISTDAGKFANKYIKSLSNKIFIAIPSLVKEMMQKKYLVVTFNSRDILGQIRAKYGKNNVTEGREYTTEFSNFDNAGLPKQIRGYYIEKEVVKESDALYLLTETACN